MNERDSQTGTFHAHLSNGIMISIDQINARLRFLKAKFGALTAGSAIFASGMTLLHLIKEGSESGLDMVFLFALYLSVFLLLFVLGFCLFGGDQLGADRKSDEREE